ncbi:nuclear transport factor 2 family protein [Tenacibaculum sp. C7A-26P2]|uniref:nuclear transport factor 2 family protein n=1 Tax=Tenacibaculum sp. C7A-26P2 TaxID=3447504 RepID=UPI003F826898
MQIKSLIVGVLCVFTGLAVTQAQHKNNLKIKKTNSKMTPKEVVIAYAEALGKGDIPTAFSYFSNEIKWHQPGSNKFSGTKNGPNGVGEMFSQMMDISKGTFALKPNGNIMENNDLVVMPVRFSGEIENRKIDMAGIDLFKVVDGKVTEVWLFSDDQVVEDNFWGK